MSIDDNNLKKQDEREVKEISWWLEGDQMKKCFTQSEEAEKIKPIQDVKYLSN